MVVKNGDESHGRIRKKSPTKTNKSKSHRINKQKTPKLGSISSLIYTAHIPRFKWSVAHLERNQKLVGFNPTHLIPTIFLIPWVKWVNVQNPVDIPLYWWVNRDPYNGLLKSLYNWVV